MEGQGSGGFEKGSGAGDVALGIMAERRVDMLGFKAHTRSGCKPSRNSKAMECTVPAYIFSV